MIHICSLAKLEETVAKSGAERVLSLLAAGTEVTRPASIARENHLHLVMHDIAVAQDGMTMPGEDHVRNLLDFARKWDRAKPMVVHCYAGISRSTASAYIIAAALAPKRDEVELAQTLRKLSPSATPNPRLIAVADALLSRQGRMIEAIEAIGRGADAFEGTPFVLKIDG
ncbi:MULTISPECIES: tyrosine phosphatase family protein [unclassified Mesorhizobium]|uniref:tyrosine phosphatase family protein n=1 Tax=unclassified Mesorhizobium TaxID=325217 RepID=UPI0003CF5A64|nr:MULTISPECIES: tyrosine phosphatase family protein [unclassified Mesorhizobium]ESX16159.1 protein tyrosine/serine phosphatase [Mesorhizobium sp. LSJC255A00]ESX29684.1 protein tyrosine/serine phosphatase [Mesorhizobium sp. LSHC440B00]ESX35392.1 protein tyrosine/serine phosphatase [Mesorhizobium sp. LSHC432A00]ESX41604.1 protein tyrosine/serine phosphatase [Mesorhizobium sp. LSHC440A00]ESX75949.1 protein tyrosine/serine phosphatase [Mesorhizobium sp. LSHC414A00]